jgi:hypothetical protein
MKLPWHDMQNVSCIASMTRSAMTVAVRGMAHQNRLPSPTVNMKTATVAATASWLAGKSLPTAGNAGK